MPVQLVALTSLNPDAESDLETYLAVVGPLMESAGASIINRYQLSESIAGDNDFQFVTLVEYPDKASVHEVFDSDKYKSLTETKRRAFAKYQVNVIAAT